MKCAGYRLYTKLELLQANDNRCRVAAWNLLQLPGGGDMVIPVHHPQQPVVYFGDIPWAFRGEREAVHDVAMQLLGVPI